MSSPAQSSLGAGTVVAGTYEVTRLIGRGGMGSVWEASHRRLPGKRVAIKILHADVASDDDALARFRREAEIASRLGHPNIVEVHDFHTLPDGSPYLVLELLEGESLDARLRRGPLPLDRVHAITRQVAAALLAAHGQGVVHRDLKPQNVFLVATEAEGRAIEVAKVLDFGISKIRGSQTVKTQDSTLLGTPQYMAPEQATGNHSNVDERTDVFALGAMVYEMIAGAPAFSGATIPEVVFKVVYGEPPWLAEVAPETPAPVVSAIHRALAKERDDRWPDVSAFVEALTGDRLATRRPGRPARAGDEASPAVDSARHAAGIATDATVDSAKLAAGVTDEATPSGARRPAGIATDATVDSAKLPAGIADEATPRGARRPLPDDVAPPPATAEPTPRRPGRRAAIVAAGIVAAAALALFALLGGEGEAEDRPGSVAMVPAEADPEPPAEPAPQAHANPAPDSEHEPPSEPGPDSHSEPQADSAAASDSPSKPDSHSEPQAASASDPPSEPNSPSEPDPDSEPEPRADSESQPEPAPQADSSSRRRRPAPDSRAAAAEAEPAALPADVRADLAEARRRLAAGGDADLREALRLAERAIRRHGDRLPAAHALRARAYCRLQNLGGANEALRATPPRLRRSVRRYCQKNDFPLP